MNFDWSISVTDLVAVMSAVLGFIYFVNKLSARIDVVEHDLSGIARTLDRISVFLDHSSRLEGRVDELEHRIDAISRRLDTHLSQCPQH